MDTARIAATVASIAQAADATNQVDFSLDHFGDSGERPTVTVTAAHWVSYTDREPVLSRVAAAIDPAMEVEVVEAADHGGRRWFRGYTVRGGVAYIVTSALSGGES